MTEWTKIYGCQSERVATINICGGCAEWWNYVLVFKDKDYTLYREDRFGRHLLSVKLIYHRDEEEVKEVFDIDDYEVQDDEVVIDYDFFCWE
jgi:hypothetical protein